MFSKIFPFNKTLLKKDFNMVKVSIILVTLLILGTTTLNVISSYNNFKDREKHYIENNIEYEKENLIELEKNNLYKNNSSNLMVAILLPITIIGVLFGEEKRRKTFEILKVMPYTRYQVFFNKLLVVFIALAIPFLINGLIMLLALGVNSKLRLFYSANQIIIWILQYLYYQLPILGFTLLISTLTGTTISQMILTGIFLIFPEGFIALLSANLEFWGFYQLSERVFNILENNFIGILGVTHSIPRGSRFIIFYLLLSIVLVVLSKVLFDKNKIERNGETLEFEGTENFFKIGVSICTSLLVAVIITGFYQGHTTTQILLLIIGYIIGGGLGYFLSNWSIKLNGSKA